MFFGVNGTIQNLAYYTDLTHLVTLSFDIFLPSTDRYTATNNKFPAKLATQCSYLQLILKTKIIEPEEN